MSKKPLYNISLNNLDKLVQLLENYESELDEKAKRFCQELADVGIRTAQSNTGEWNGFIFFEKQDTENGTIIIASDIEVLKVWYTDKELTNERSYPVHPLLLAEFGSGWFADNKWDIGGVGQGTMPGQTHANDPNGWYWYDEAGIKHHSKGELPTYPLYRATIEMMLQIQTVARKVFR